MYAPSTAEIEVMSYDMHAAPVAMSSEEAEGTASGPHQMYIYSGCDFSRGIQVSGLLAKKRTSC